MKIEIDLSRFILKPLKEHHVTDEYLSWFDDVDAKKYIDYALKEKSRDELKKFVRSKDSKCDVLFLGIFNKINMNHIGNIKYEPIDVNAKTATMGILIGASEWRGMGVGPEVIRGSALWLKRNMGISRILLGVEHSNLAAVKAYNKIGFKEINGEPVGFGSTTMFMEMRI
jgi:[ribosomal protein S5]-alanine N-acetyltransferase